MVPSVEEFFLAHLDQVERAARFVARRAGLSHEDADDLCAALKLHLIENDYAILRRFGGRCSFATYAASVAYRLCSDEWSHVHGRWRASAEAKRLGEAAVLLEVLLLRDGSSFEEAVALAQRVHPTLTASAAAEIAARLPERPPRLKLVPLANVDDRDDRVLAVESADSRVADAELAVASDAASRVVRETLRAVSAEDRVVLRLRFDDGMRVSDIARMLACDQKQLYRRIDAMVRRLRDALVAAGIDAAAAEALIGVADSHLHFGLRDPENGPPRLTMIGRESGSEEMPR
jgi:RNA polymerase sigma factor (sigma-70 family)